MPVGPSSGPFEAGASTCEEGGRRSTRWVGGALGAGLFLPPPPPGGAEFVQAPKKIFGLNNLAPKAAEKSFDRPEARRKIWPNIQVHGGMGGWCGTPPPPAVVPSFKKKKMCVGGVAISPCLGSAKHETACVGGEAGVLQTCQCCVGAGGPRFIKPNLSAWSMFDSS